MARTGRILSIVLGAAAVVAIAGGGAYFVLDKMSGSGDAASVRIVEMVNKPYTLGQSAEVFDRPMADGKFLTRIRQGGNVTAAMLINRVQPVYPPLARQTRISGTVRLHAIIGKDGSVQQLEVLSGHPLLVQSALDAVRQWRYRPTLLNNEPVEVDTTIDVIFSLNQ